MFPIWEQRLSKIVEPAAGQGRFRRSQRGVGCRIKRLRGLLHPQYRLRVDEVRVFYDVFGTTVEVLAIVTKSEADKWLAQFANPE